MQSDVNNLEETDNIITLQTHHNLSTCFDVGWIRDLMLLILGYFGAVRDVNFMLITQLARQVTGYCWPEFICY